MYHRLFRITLLGTAIAIILAACGAPIPTTAPTIAVEQSTAVTTLPFAHTACADGIDLTGKTVSLYHILALVGEQNDTFLQPLKAGFDDATEYFNAQGGVCGASLAQVFADTEMSAPEIYERVVALEPKPALVTLYGSGDAEDLRDQLAKDEIPGLGIRVGSVQALYGEDGQTPGWIFGTNPLYVEQVGSMCDYIAANPDIFPKPVLGFISWDYGWAHSSDTEESRAYCQSVGVGYAGASYFAGDSTYIQPHIQNLIDAGATILYTNSLETGPVLVAKTLDEMGLQGRVTLAAVNWAMDPTVGLLGGENVRANGLPAMSGMIGSLPLRSWTETNHPGIQLLTQQADLHQRPPQVRNHYYTLAWASTDLYIEVYIQTGNRVGFNQITGAEIKNTLENIVYAPLGDVERIDYQGGARRALAEDRIGEMHYLGQDGKTPASANNPPMLVQVGDQKHMVPMILPVSDFQPAPDLRPGGADAPVVTNPRSQTKAPDSTLVGEWQRVNSCTSFVQAFKDSGLIDLAPEWLVGAGYFTSLDQIDSTDLCKGATEVVHSHFFTADAKFGSHDEKGRQVDDGRYQMVDDHTITFLPAGDVTVYFYIEGETLMFEVVVPDPCVGSCREATAWALSAFYPRPFQRVP